MLKGKCLLCFKICFYTPTAGCSHHFCSICKLKNKNKCSLCHISYYNNDNKKEEGESFNNIFFDDINDEDNEPIKEDNEKNFEDSYTFIPSIDRPPTVINLPTRINKPNNTGPVTPKSISNTNTKLVDAPEFPF